MTGRIAALSAGVLLVCAFGAQAKEGKPQAAMKGGGKAVMMPVGDLKWVDPPNAPAGVKMAVLWGDPAKGAHGAMHKFPAGFAAPLHHHSAGHHVAVISGTLELTPEGKPATKLGPGSYFAFTGKKKHTTACLPGSDCVLFVDCGGAWDVVMADAPKDTPKK